MAKKRVRHYLLCLQDILESIRKIRSYTEGMPFDQFAADVKTVDAVVRNFEIIGEASKQSPQHIKDKYPDIEWRSMLDFRNVIIHEYFALDLEIMWDIIETKLPPLEVKVSNLVERLSRTDSRKNET